MKRWHRYQISRCVLLVSLVFLACRTRMAEDTGIASVSPTPSALTVSTPAQALRQRDIHRAEGAGRWYPGDPDKLRSAVETYIGQADVRSVPGRPLAVVVPHAGYVYSGAVAGYSFRILQEAGCAGHTLVVLGDTHAGMGTADVAVWAAGAFETPLGLVHVDERIAQAVVDADPGIEFERRAFQSEHPVENQMPFVQVACPGAHIVPIVIRDPALENARVLADALVAALDHSERPVTIVASTDLSHFYPYEKARQIDEVALQAIASLDPEAVLSSPQRCDELGIADRPLTMCSMGSVMTAVMAARQMGADQATVLHYANSGDVPFGSRDQVVGYGAVVLWQSSGSDGDLLAWESSFALDPLSVAPPEPVSLSPDAQQVLLDLARRTVAQFLASETMPPFRDRDPVFHQHLGAYVTYEKAGSLRGCLGRLVGDRPVYLNVQYAAVAAALSDSRFQPITLEELEGLDIEVTLLYPMREVEDPDQIELGRDGILMRVGDEAGALFLPQVPVEQGWVLSDTLRHLCQKAGLPEGAWRRDDARLYAFGGQWFGKEH